MSLGRDVYFCNSTYSLWIPMIYPMGSCIGPFADNCSQRRYRTRRRCISHTQPGAVFFKLDRSKAKRAPVPSNTSPTESSRRVVSNADLHGTDAIPNCGDIEHGKSAQGCAIYTVLYGSWMVQNSSAEAPQNVY